MLLQSDRNDLQLKHMNLRCSSVNLHTRDKSAPFAKVHAMQHCSAYLQLWPSLSKVYHKHILKSVIKLAKV